MDKTDLPFIKKNRKHNNNKNSEIDEIDGPSSIIVDTNNPEETDLYDINHANIGIALIFSHKTINGQTIRKGTEHDRQRLRNILKLYGFEIRSFDDLNYAEIMDVLEKVSNEDHSHNDCLCVTIMTHGTTGKIFAKDMQYSVEKLWTPFLGNRCKSLINKPKIFFIQACRGENFDAGVELRAMRRFSSNRDTLDAGSNQVAYKIPTTADLIVMYSTYEGNISWRNALNGSWFIQCLCDELEKAYEKGKDVELFYLLTSVSRSVAINCQSNVPGDKEMDHMKQMPSFVSTLTKFFYLRRR